MPRFVRFREDGYPFFVTAVIQNRRPLFSEVANARMMVEVLDQTRRRYGFLLLAFAVMPDHVHVLVVPRVGDTVSQVVRFIKGTFARQYNIAKGRKGPVWQPGFYERMVRDEKALTDVLEYIDMNPVVAGLVGRPEDWAFGSASGVLPTDLQAYLS